MEIKKPIVFKTEDSIWQMMKDGTKTWDFRRHDMSDDRIYRLSWGKFESFPHGASPKYVPEESTVQFLNKDTHEILEIWFWGLKFTDFAPGWCFIILGSLKSFYDIKGWHQVGIDEEK